MKDNFSKLTDLLRELFQLDQADLDFGIYRIMNARRDEINRFLGQDLLPQVRETFSEYKSADKALLKQELDKAIDGAKALGYDPDTAPKVKELREKYEASSVDVAGLENEVYDHLYSFFKRYYDEGDFISLRRYKEGVYAIPYEGEEVKLYWANHDQYYIKTTENFRDYAFKLTDGSHVHFKIIEADTEKDNIKPTNGKDRRFLLVEENPVAEDNGELIIRFEYQPDEQKRKQDQLNTEIASRIMELLKTEGLEAWEPRLTAKWNRVDGIVTDRTILEKHLTDYTRRNTFDYFIHKNLGEFLRRELDFYIKNEVMRLDDVESESAPRVEQYLSKIKVIRKIAHKIIDFLAQIEDFQKKLWLKKKFVVETNYCITLDRIPEELYPEIAASEAQREEWVRLFAIDEITGDMVTQAYSVPLTVEFLKENSHLVLDTGLFEAGFKARLLEAVDDIDERCDGLLVNSENFQALQLLEERYLEQVKNVYIDPPYNTAATEILYKNDYKHSSWCSLLFDRMNISRNFLNKKGVLEVAIDDMEFHRLEGVTRAVFGDQNHIANIAIMHNPKGRDQEHVADCHDYTIIASKDHCLCETYRLGLAEERMKKKYPKTSGDSHYRELPLRRSGSGAQREDRPYMYFPFIYNKSNKILNVIPKEEYEKIYDGSTFDDEYVSQLRRRYEDNDFVFILPMRDDGSMGRWRWGYDACLKGCMDKILFAKLDGKPTVYQIDEANDSYLPKTLWYGERYDASTKGTNLLKDIIGKNVFDYPKSLYTVMDMLTIGSLDGSIILDFFAGSGTTGHAVVELNRCDNKMEHHIGRRKYILVEMAYYFDSALMPRMKKVIYSKDWKGGKPVSRNTGVSHMFKYLRLESYEDALANIQLTRTDAQKELLGSSVSFRESYMLKYMLDTESRESPSLLNIDCFEDPFSYQLLVGTGSVGETKAVNADLVETFNWLLGLRVQRIKPIQGYLLVEGANPEGEKVLVIWRKIRDQNETDPQKVAEARRKANDDLDAFFREQHYNQAESQFDIIYVNGDNNLMNIPVVPGGDEPPYRVRLIEEEFKRLMFDVKDV